MYNIVYIVQEPHIYFVVVFLPYFLHVVFSSQHSLIFFATHMFFFMTVGLLNGYPTFITSILMIGLNTAVIGDVAGHLGCFIYLKDSVNAIAFVALGTSVPGNEK